MNAGEGWEVENDTHVKGGDGDGEDWLNGRRHIYTPDMAGIMIPPA
jgi:hypothetical protein